jgi:fluoride ion exporter CrcB/FEX
MIIMMDGSANPYLGKQIFAALFGYLLGYQASLASYRVGRTLGAWRSRAASGGDEDPRDDIIYDATPRRSGDGEPKIRSRCHRNRNLPRWMAPMLLSVVVVVLIGLLVAGDAYWGIPYYRELWIGSILAPMGTLLRYRLSALNGGKLGIRGGIYWFPFGTFLANLLGSIISAAIAAWIIVTSTTNDGVGDARRSSWTIQVLNAISMGVAGCLSTVSTYAKECVELGEKFPPHDRKQFAYSHGTMLCCCLFGLIVYSPIVRFA